MPSSKEGDLRGASYPPLPNRYPTTTHHPNDSPLPRSLSSAPQTCSGGSSHLAWPSGHSAGMRHSQVSGLTVTRMPSRDSDPQ